MKFETALLTKQGGRNYNEDFCAYREKDDYGCYLLTDGLGGHQGGAFASKLIGEKVLEAFEANPACSEGKLRRYLEFARNAFIEAQKTDPALKSMKATLVVLLTDFREAIWGHTGDSRLYYFRGGRMYDRTKDHSVPQRLADSGAITEEQIRSHEDRNRLTQAFDGGDLDRFEVLQKPVELYTEDAFLLCSDGFWEFVLDGEMENYLSESASPEQWLNRMEEKLLKVAPPKNDNYSAVAIFAGSR